MPMSSAVHVLALAKLLVATGAVVLRSNVNAKGEFFAYDYSKHGQDWMAGNCASRSRQSPIDLPLNVPVGGTFAYKYNPIVSPFEIMNNGHAFSADFSGEGYGGITYENAWYNLLNINVHSLSEHTCNGEQKPLELHMVHKRSDGEALLIVAVSVESPLLTGLALKRATQAAHPGFLQVNASQVPLWPRAAGSGYAEPVATEPGFNPTLQAFLKTPPPPINMKIRVPADSAHSFDLNALMGGGDFYDYAGSLTAPPCAEIATWLVRKEPLQASDLQVLYLHDAIYKTTADYGNFRSIMPLNGRILGMRKGILEDLAPTAAPPVTVPNVPAQSDREYRAMKWAQDAMTIANHATAYVKDLDSRIRGAAQAHANALAPQLEPLTVHGQVIVPGNAAQASLGAVPTLAPLGTVQQQTPLQIQATAEIMARTLATAAREEIEQATQEIHERSIEVAKKAAMQAANMVLSGNVPPPGAMPPAQ